MLTDRELEILKLRKEGKTQAEIAQKLKISQPAVSSFERNARKKIVDAEVLLETLKKLGLLALGLLFLPFLVAETHAATPNPGHAASSVGAGTFAAGNFTFQNSLVVNVSQFIVNDTAGRVEITGDFLLVNLSGSVIFNATDTERGVVRFGSTNSNISILVNGTINATGAITQNSGFDVAEMFSATEPMGPGDLVAIAGSSSVKKATKAEADLVIGAVSTQPGFIMANPYLSNPVIVGLAGRIPVKVTGPVVAGDFITISDTAGVGEKATSAGYVIGRALESNVNGVVMMIIQPYYFNPSVKADGSLVGGRDTKKEFIDESAVGEAIRTGTLDVQVNATQPQGGVANAQQITTQDATISGELSTDLIRPEQGKDVVVVIG